MIRKKKHPLDEILQEWYEIEEDGNTCNKTIALSHKLWSNKKVAKCVYNWRLTETEIMKLFTDN